ncbi:hypothetical protein [Brevundimonas sp.]|uniref:hypothetical protein n=1 Tax=Brevundimonas sp. TaxID=1871086 RepID=UPI002D6FB7FD|nr:hypothetical protein [Brevundimonas sp.]HYC96761.1 hypothetical protein [Brevundimonas sp.]
MLAHLSFIAALLFAPLATAQDGPATQLPEFPIRSAVHAQADREAADALIAGSGHAAMFENVSDQQGTAVRHRASAMVCRFWPGVSVNSIHVYNPTPGAEDISCQTGVEGASLTHYASMYTPTPTAEAEAHSAIAAVRNRWPDLRAYDGEAVRTEVTGPGFPRRYISRGVVTQSDGNEYMTKVSVAKAGGWIIKQRMTVRLDKALRGDLWSESMMIRILIELADGKDARAAPEAE